MLIAEDNAVFSSSLLNPHAEHLVNLLIIREELKSQPFYRIGYVLAINQFYIRMFIVQGEEKIHISVLVGSKAPDTLYP